MDIVELRFLAYRCALQACQTEDPEVAARLRRASENYAQAADGLLGFGLR